jgi:hypothetical protein
LLFCHFLGMLHPDYYAKEIVISNLVHEFVRLVFGGQLDVGYATINVTSCIGRKSSEEGFIGRAYSAVFKPSA